MSAPAVTAAILVIGDEILSGRTKDKNIGYIAEYLTGIGIDIDVDERARAMMLERFRPEDLNEARLRMARIPHGADLVDNPISRAPGFKIGNVVVMAGVPSIMHAMLDAVAPTLSTGARMIAETIPADKVPEGRYAQGLSEIAKAHGAVSIGSYPSFGP